jgi:hypothetical protein
MQPGKIITNSLFWKKTPFRGFVVAALALNILSVLAFFVLRGNIPPVIPLLYGRPSGESQLVPSLGLLVAPGISLFFLAVNLLISGFVGDIFAKKLLITAGLLLSLLTSITLFKIIFLVGFF